MQVQGFHPISGQRERAITPACKIVRKQRDGTEVLIRVLLTRDDHVICAMDSDRPGEYRKFHLPFTSACEMPILSGGEEFTVLVPEEAAMSPEKETAAPVARVRGGETKLDKCRAIFKANAGLSKPEVVALFIADAGCTAGGANTYYINIKRELTS